MDAAAYPASAPSRVPLSTCLPNAHWPSDHLALAAQLVYQYTYIAGSYARVRALLGGAGQVADPTLEGLHSLLGRVLADTDRLEEAQRELFLATLEHADDEEAAEALAGVDEKVGALSAAQRKQLTKDFEKSRPH